MVKSLNTEMAHTTKGTWFREGPIYGNIMVGDKAFEFYNDTKLQDYVQIPWDEITYVIADVYFGGKFIPRFEIRTKQGMVKSLNTEMAHTTKGTWFREGPIYGNIMVGDKAFEFYNDTKLQDYVQIPWDEITYVIADVYFGGKFIPRFEIRTKQNGRFRFASRKSRITLKEIQKRIPRESLRKAPSFIAVLKQGFKNLFRLIVKKK